jgi:hypothetical protein
MAATQALVKQPEEPITFMVRLSALTVEGAEFKTSDMKWGDFFCKFVDCKEEKDRPFKNLYFRVMCAGDKKFKNLCYSLHDNISKWAPENRKIHLLLMSLVPTTEYLSLALNRYKAGKPWPPCDNYDGDEPLNMRKFGQNIKSDHTCPKCHADYHPKNDNIDENMVVIIPPKSNARVGYNKYMLLEWFNNQIAAGKQPSDPLTRLPISDDQYLQIAGGGNYSEIML